LSVDVEAIVFAEATWFFLVNLVDVENLPFLVGTVVLVPDNDWSTFFILSSVDVKCLSVLHVDEVFTFISEKLPPLGVGVVDLHLLVSSGVFDVP
jgi:hypothetical protein